MSWQSLYRREHARRNYYAQRELEKILPSYSIPVGDSAYTAPGWLFVANTFSTVPDALYPWDPAVVRAIREFCPDAVPITIKSVWQWSNYNELGHLGEPLVIMRHGLARNIRDLWLPPHQFHCTVPAGPGHGIHTGTLQSLNYLEVHWHDRNVRALGQDLPGAFLPFDWEFYHALRSRYESTLKPKDLSKKIVGNPRSVQENRDRRRQAERAYEQNQLRKFYCEEPSDLEWKNYIYGGGKQAPVATRVVVPKQTGE